MTHLTIYHVHVCFFHSCVLYLLSSSIHFHQSDFLLLPSSTFPLTPLLFLISSLWWFKYYFFLYLTWPWYIYIHWPLTSTTTTSTNTTIPSSSHNILFVSPSPFFQPSLYLPLYIYLPSSSSPLYIAILTPLLPYYMTWLY